MNKDKVEQVAREHKLLAEPLEPPKHLDTHAAQVDEARALDQLWGQVERESAAYCASYNEAFGASRIWSEVHPNTVVVRAELGQQDTLVFCRTVPTPAHPGRVEAHRYHYPERPVDLAVGLRRTTAGTLTLTYLDQDKTPEDFVLELLSIFGEQLARAEARRERAAGGATESA
jgi:hypothetical protein